MIPQRRGTPRNEEASFGRITPPLPLPPPFACVESNLKERLFVPPGIGLTLSGAGRRHKKRSPARISTGFTSGSPPFSRSPTLTPPPGAPFRTLLFKFWRLEAKTDQFGTQSRLSPFSSGFLLFCGLCPPPPSLRRNNLDLPLSPTRRAGRLYRHLKRPARRCHRFVLREGSFPPVFRV